MALAPMDLLAAIVAPPAALLSDRDGLAIQNRGTGRGVAPSPLPLLFAQTGMKALPGAIGAPLAEIVIHRLVWRVLTRQHAPGAPAAHQGKDAVENLAQIDAARATTRLGWGEQWSQHHPFWVADIAGGEE